MGYTLDYVSNAPLPRRMGCQAPIPPVTKETTPQYPDVQSMFHAANLLMMPKHVPQKENPVYEEVPRKINHVPSVKEEAPHPDQKQAREFKDTGSKECLHQEKSPKSLRCNCCQKIYSPQSVLKVRMQIHRGTAILVHSLQTVVRPSDRPGISHPFAHGRKNH